MNITKNLKRSIAVAAATMAFGTVLTVSPAEASVVSSGGDVIQVAAACQPGALGLAVSNYGFDYMTTIAYVYGEGWTNWQPWAGVPQGESVVAAASNVSANRWVAIYAYYADWNGYSWEYGGEWVTFGGSYWCYV